MINPKYQLMYMNDYKCIYKDFISWEGIAKYIWDNHITDYGVYELENGAELLRVQPRMGRSTSLIYENANIPVSVLPYFL